jgi:hypothetical protein
MFIRLVVLLLLTAGCSPNLILGQVNHWMMQSHTSRDKVKKYCAKEGKTPDVVFKDGSTYFSKLECVDK